MSLKKIIATSLLAGTGYAAFYLYKHRDLIKEHSQNSDETIDLAIKDSQAISRHSQTIQSELAKLPELQQDLTYKVTVFNKETQARLSQIKAIWAKYDNKEKA